MRQKFHVPVEPEAKLGICTSTPIDGYRAREESGNKALIVSNKGLTVACVMYMVTFVQLHKHILH